MFSFVKRGENRVLDLFFALESGERERERERLNNITSFFVFDLVAVSRCPIARFFPLIFSLSFAKRDALATRHCTIDKNPLSF